MSKSKYYKHFIGGETAKTRIKAAMGEEYGDFFLEKVLNLWGATDKTSGALVAAKKTKKNLKAWLDSPKFEERFIRLKQTQEYKNAVKDFKKAN